jgi:hypothetical protein
MNTKQADSHRVGGPHRADRHVRGDLPLLTCRYRCAVSAADLSVAVCAHRYRSESIASPLARCGAPAVARRRIPSVISELSSLRQRGVRRPGSAPRYLLDSNVDGGQDTRKLKWWLDARGISRICFAYYGAEPRSAFGFTYVDVPANPGEHHANIDCVVAAAVQYLYLHDEVAGF